MRLHTHDNPACHCVQRRCQSASPICITRVLFMGPRHAGLVAAAFHGASHLKALPTGSSMIAKQMHSVRHGDDSSMQKACNSLRSLLRSHLACSDAASAAFCTWAVAVVENVPQQTQAMILGAGLLDVIFDRISKQLNVCHEQLCQRHSRALHAQCLKEPCEFRLELH